MRFATLPTRSTTAKREEPTTDEATSNATVVQTKRPNQQDEDHGFACCNQQGELPPVVYCLAMMRRIVMKLWKERRGKKVLNERHGREAIQRVIAVAPSTLSTATNYCSTGLIDSKDKRPFDYIR